MQIKRICISFNATCMQMLFGICEFWARVCLDTSFLSNSLISPLFLRSLVLSFGLLFTSPSQRVCKGEMARLTEERWDYFRVKWLAPWAHLS